MALRNQTANALKQIDVQLKRRHDLIPNLVQTVQGAMSFERETLEAVVEAYPDLKATGNIAQLQEELASTENKIGFARHLYTDTATEEGSGSGW